MKKVFYILFLCIFGSLQATEPSIETRIAVVNLKDIAKTSKAGRSIDEQLAVINDKSKKDLLDLESSIKKMDSDAKNSSDERKVEDLQVILYDMTKEKRYQIQSAYRVALETLEEEIHKVIREIANEKGFTLVVISEAVVFNGSNCPDITKEVLERLDNRVDKIKIDMKNVKI